MPLTPAQANSIFTNRLGCRYDDPNNRVGYGFLDIEGYGENGGSITPPMDVIVQWLQNPNHADFEPRWHDRLWNTCGHIIAFHPAGNVLLVTNLNPVYERRPLLYPIARGDSYTFRQDHLVSPASLTVATIPYGGNLAQGVGVSKESVEQLFNTILETLKKLATKAFNE